MTTKQSIPQAVRALAKAKRSELGATGKPRLFVAAITPLDLGDGDTPIKITRPGWSLDGDLYWPADVLERDASLFAAGTQMFLDHAKQTDKTYERPEGSLRDLVGALSTTATWDENGADGPGLYADAAFLDSWRDFVATVAPISGISMRVWTLSAPGEAEGRMGEIVQAILAVKSVDLVTRPAMDGKILEAVASLRDGIAASVDSSKYDIADESEKESEMAEENSDSIRRLAELEQSVKDLTGKLDTLTAERDEAMSEAARANEAVALRDAHDLVEVELASSELPDVTRERLAKELAAAAPITEGKLDEAALKVKISERVESEREYLGKLGTAPRVTQSGSAPVPGEDFAAQTVDAFRRLGLDEESAKQAARVRN